MTKSTSAPRPLFWWALILFFFIVCATLFTSTGAQWTLLFLFSGFVFLAAASWTYYSRSVFSTFVTVLLLFFLFALLSLYMRRVAGVSDMTERERAQKRIETRMQLDREGRALLSSVGWVEASKGIIHVPIGEAMSMEIEALKKKTPHAAYPIVVPPAAPPVAAAPATPAPAVGKTATPVPGAPAASAAAAKAPAIAPTLSPKR